MAEKLYVGNEPAKGVMVQSDGNWCLYELKSIGEFRNFKLISMTPIPFKANYYFGFNAGIGKMVNSRDIKKLKEYRKDIYIWMLQSIADMIALEKLK